MVGKRACWEGGPRGKEYVGGTHIGVARVELAPVRVLVCLLDSSRTVHIPRYLPTVPPYIVIASTAPRIRILKARIPPN